MNNELLIVGAGPTGLTAAVELARRGIKARVVDKKARASTLSRAVGINARTLHLLAESGVSNKLIDRGIKIREARFHVKNEPAFCLNLGLAPEPYDFLLALPQDETENALIEKFESLGGNVEFGVRLSNLTLADEHVTAELKHLGEDRIESKSFANVFGADGTKSVVRRAAGLDYPGVELPDKWSILDFDSASWPHRDRLCLFAYEHGRVCLTVPIGKNRYRGVTDRPDARTRMPSGLKIDNIRREGDFVISVKQADCYQKGRAFIGGDAAHSHSPVGGRGMNLGIADACCFARMFVKGNTSVYSEIRHPAAKETIRITERARRFITSDSIGKFFILERIAPLLLHSAFIHESVVSVALDTPR